MENNQKSSFRSEVKDFTATESDNEFDQLNDFQKSQWMLRTYIEKIIRVVNPGQVPDDSEDLNICFTDGAKDAGIDFFYREPGHVLIIQAKFRGQGKPENEGEFDHFCNVLSRIHPKHGKDFKKNKRLSELVSEIDWENDTFDLQYITLGRSNANIKARQANGTTDFLSGLEERVEVSCFDESDLNQKLREAQSTGEEINVPIEIKLKPDGGDNPWITYQNEEGRISYIGYIKAADIRNLYQHHRNRLFAQNIRNYIGDTSTNKGIINTALTESNDFFFFNNGISAIATKISPNTGNNSLLCERFSIINGAQTVRSIAKAHLKDPTKAAAATILIRISNYALRHTEKEEQFLDRITRFNNTQNNVKISDFRSNDPIQRALANKFSNIYRGGKQYWYKNKRGGGPDARRISISMEDFSKTIFSFRFGPPDGHGGNSFLFDTSKDGGYALIYGKDGEVPETLTDETFKILSGTWFICEEIRERLGEAKEKLAEKPEASGRQALEQRWLFFFTVGELLRKKYGSESKLNTELARLSKPKLFDDDNQTTKAVSKYAQHACDILQKLYIRASRLPNFVHRNWFRSSETVKDILGEIEFSSLLIETMPLLKIL